MQIEGLVVVFFVRGGGSSLFFPSCLCAWLSRANPGARLEEAAPRGGGRMAAFAIGGRVSGQAAGGNGFGQESRCQSWLCLCLTSELSQEFPPFWASVYPAVKSGGLD